MYFKTEILFKFLHAKLAPDLKAYTCVIYNPYLSVGMDMDYYYILHAKSDHNNDVDNHVNLATA
jgi:hypothetical protein